METIVIKNNHTDNQSSQPDMMSVIREWEASGQSQKLFCQIRNIPFSKFYYWLRKYRRSQSTLAGNDFIPVRIRQSKSIGAMDIQYPNGVVVKLHPPIDISMLRAMIQLL